MTNQKQQTIDEILEGLISDSIAHGVNTADMFPADEDEGFINQKSEEVKRQLKLVILDKFFTENGYLRENVFGILEDVEALFEEKL